MADSPSVSKRGFFTAALGGSGTLDLGPLEMEWYKRLTAAGITIDASGVITFGVSPTGVTAVVTPAGSDTQVQFNDAGSLGADAGLVYNKTTDTLTAGALAVTGAATVGTTLGVTGAATVGTTLGVTGTTTLTGALVGDATTDSTSITTGAFQTDGGLGVAKALFVGTTANVAGAATLQSTLAVTGATTLASGSGGTVTLGGGATPSELRFLESSMGGSNYMAFKAQGMTGNVTYWLPAADGSSGQMLSTDGAGTLAWATASAGVNALNKTANYTVATSDGSNVVVACDATSGAFTITLPTAVGNTQRIVLIKSDTSANAVTVNTTSAQTIGLFASGAIALYRLSDSLVVSSDGTNWQINAGSGLKPFCSAANSGTLTVTAGNTTALTLDTDVSDSWAMHSTASNTSRITIPTNQAGIYLVMATSKAFLLGASTKAALILRKNNTTNVCQSDFFISADLNNDFVSFTAMWVGSLAAADYVEVYGKAVTNNVQFGEAAVAGSFPALVAIRL